MNGDSGRLLADIGLSSSYKWESQTLFVQCKTGRMLRPF